MLKKRLIFTLLYHRGQFMLSRNFRLQKVGDMRWLQKNYNFSKISFSIDELVVLDVTRDGRDSRAFCYDLAELCKDCFVPVAAGGGVRSLETAKALLRSGADKVVVNTALYAETGFVEQLAAEFGQQCIVAAVDVKQGADGFQAYINNGETCIPGTASDWIERVSSLSVGEIYLNSIDKDGTGQGYHIELLDLLPENLTQPLILAGGAGNAAHLAEGLSDPRTSAVATAHLFNFVGDGLSKARQNLIGNGVDLAYWDMTLLNSLRVSTRSLH